MQKAKADSQSGGLMGKPRTIELPCAHLACLKADSADRQKAQPAVTHPVALHMLVEIDPLTGKRLLIRKETVHARSGGLCERWWLVHKVEVHKGRLGGAATLHTPGRQKGQPAATYPVAPTCW